jgi:AraC-like DNA-binding protein
MTERPNPEVLAAADPLSDVLRALRLTGGVFLHADFTAPWSIRTRISAHEWRPYLSAPTQVIAYHVILEGALTITVEGEAPLQVRAGEIVLLPRNDSHTLASAAGIPPVSAGEMIMRSGESGLFRISHGGGGAATHLVCGFLGSEDLNNPLLLTLPKALKIDVNRGTSYDWIESSVRFAAGELAKGRLATSSVMSRLSECLLAEAIRHHAASRPDDETAWLKGLSDPQIGRVLALIHRDVAAHWSAETLAREAALSRSAFMDRFASVVGMPPFRYLALLRLQTARLQLRETAKSIGQIAHAVGYESEEAFSRAFKREYGVPPAKWRDGVKAEGA